MNWQTSGTPADDPFAKAEADVRAMTSSQWWQTAAPPQRAEQVASRLLAGPGEWWLFGAWGRWYRCGLDAHWHPSPPPADQAARRILAPAPPGVGNPPVPPQLVPTGPDVGAGPMATAGLLGEGPSADLVARVQQTLITAIAVDPQQFAMQDPAFQPGTPTTVAALWGAILFSSGTPVVLGEHPLVAMFAPYLTVQAEHLRWMIAPDLMRLAGYYTDRLSAGDPVGAAFLVRMMGEAASALATDPAFQPGASALAAVCATTLQYVQADLQAIPYGAQTVAREWLRRCPAEYAAPIVREASPGEYLRLALYDLAVLFGELTEGIPPNPTDLRRAAAAIMAADLQTVPHAVPAVLPWLDPESARTVQEVLGQAQHPLRELFPQGVRLPPKLSSTDPAQVRALLATSHALAMTACRLAQTAPQHLEFIVPAACAAELGTPALSRPKGTGELSAWEIINAARKHLADERSAAQPAAEAAPPPAPAPLPSPAPPPPDDDPFATRQGAASSPPRFPQPALAEPPAAQGADQQAQPAPVHDPFGEYAPEVPQPGLQPPPPYGTASPSAPGYPPAQPAPDAYGQPPAAQFGQPAPGPFGQPPAAPAPPPYPGEATAPYTPPSAAQEPSGETSPYMPTFATRTPPPMPVSRPSAPRPSPAPSAQEGGPRVVEAYGVRFLCGPDDAERMLTEVRRRGKWAQQLRGQEVSSASAPAVLLVGEPSTGQRRLARMIARALAEVGFSGNQVRTLHLEQIRERGPEGLAALLREHSGHTVLVEDLDQLILEDGQGDAYARALYRVRAEGVTETTLVAGCAPDRFDALSSAHPELVTDFRTVRLPDLSVPAHRAALLRLLAEERFVGISDDAWPTVHRDLGSLPGRGRLVNARLVEAYLDRACTRHLGTADATVAVMGERGFTLTPADLEGLADELPR
ncbi:hypothetical protein ABGB12_12845 [Actinocorallia sp. B10E7]|uniref:hypothetical protein n=1 Tax=Actinocorallia sp. B10E7 TaxID=3153558 RepID=UPI00325C860E